MNKQKQTYLSPETETLVIRFEGNLLAAPSNPLSLMATSDWGTTNTAGVDLIEDKGFNL